MSRLPADQDREVEIRCNWCAGTFTYHAKIGESHSRTACSWCGKAVHIPIDKLRPASGITPSR